MSKLNFKVDIADNLGKTMRDLLKQWPGLLYGLMSDVGYTGRVSLYENFLRGQVINLYAKPYGVDGKKRTVNYTVGKGSKSVKIRAYPLNLFNPRHVYAMAKPTVEQDISKMLKTYDISVLQKRIDRIDKEKV